jgi:hypothetical protein
LRDQLSADFRGRDASVESIRPKRWVGLTQLVHDGPDLSSKLREPILDGLDPTQGEAVDARDARSPFMLALAHGLPTPTEFPRGFALPSLAQRPNRFRHEHSASRPFQRLRRLYEQGLPSLGQ